MQKSQRRRHRGLPIFFSLLFNLVFFFGRLHRCRMYYNLGLRGCLMVGPPHKRTKKDIPFYEVIDFKAEGSQYILRYPTSSK